MSLSVIVRKPMKLLISVALLGSATFIFIVFAPSIFGPKAGLSFHLAHSNHTINIHDEEVRDKFIDLVNNAHQIPPHKKRTPIAMVIASYKSGSNLPVELDLGTDQRYFELRYASSVMQIERTKFFSIPIFNKIKSDLLDQRE